MAQFQQVVLDYLEHYNPEEFEALKAERRLCERMHELVEQLYSETERELRVLKAEYPDKPEEQLVAFAEQIAIATVAPLPSFALDLDDDDLEVWETI